MDVNNDDIPNVDDAKDQSNAEPTITAVANIGNNAPSSSMRPFTGEEYEILLKVYKEHRGQPSHNAVLKLRQEMDRRPGHIELFFESRTYFLDQRRTHAATFANHLGNLEMVILRRRFENGIKSSDEEIKELEELMDVMPGTYAYYFDVWTKRSEWVPKPPVINKTELTFSGEEYEVMLEKYKSAENGIPTDGVIIDLAWKMAVRPQIIKNIFVTRRNFFENLPRIQRSSQKLGIVEKTILQRRFSMNPSEEEIKHLEWLMGLCTGMYKRFFEEHVAKKAAEGERMDDETSPSTTTNNHRRNTVYVYSGEELEAMLKVFKQYNQNPPAEAISKLSSELRKEPHKLADFFGRRQQFLERRITTAETQFFHHLSRIEHAILQRRFENGIEATKEEIEEVETLMDVKPGMYHYYFEAMRAVTESQNSQTVKKSENDGELVEDECSEVLTDQPKIERKTTLVPDLKAVEMDQENPDQSLKNEEDQKALLSETTAAEAKGDSDMVMKPPELPEDQQDTIKEEKKEQPDRSFALTNLLLFGISTNSRCSLEEFKVTFSFEDVHVVLKLMNCPISNWIFTRANPKNPENADVEKQVTYRVTADPYSSAHEFISLLSDQFSKVTEFVAVETDNPNFMAIFDWIEVQNCDQIEILMADRMTNSKFNSILRKLHGCRRVRMTASKTRGVTLNEPFPGILDICLESPRFFERHHLMTLPWSHTEIRNESMRAELINEFLQGWIDGRFPRVESLRVCVPVEDLVIALRGLKVPCKWDDCEDQGELYNSKYGLLKDHKLGPLLKIVNCDRTKAGVYSGEEGLLELVVWRPVQGDK